MIVWTKENKTSIIDAYNKWHTSCVKYISHDFAFVIYDTKLEKYFAARDAVGIKPLYYLIQNKKFYYSDDIGDLFLQSKIKKEPNIDAMRMLMGHSTIPYDATMYKHIKRLPPGHFMTVDKDGNSQIERYWKPEEIKIDQNINEEEAKKKFLELFQLAIEERIEDISTTSFELSGGLDSSSVVSMAKQIYPSKNIETVSMAFGTLPKCDESEYIDAMKEKYDIGINKVSINDLDYRKYNLEYNYRLDPYWPILVTFTMGFPVAEKLKEMGIKRVLTGQGGDETLVGNYYSVLDHFKHFQWIQLYKEVKASRNPLKMIKLFILLPLLSKRQKECIKSIFQLFSSRTMSRDKQKNVQKKTFKELSDQYPRDPMASWYDLDKITASSQSLILDSMYYHVVEKHYGITFTHPFYDRRLLEFILSLPAKFKYHEGIKKVLLRKAMEGILPEKIRQRKDKAEFTAVIKQQIDAIDLDELLDDSKLAELGLIEQTEIDQLKETYTSGKMKTVVYFWKIINMEYWYRYNFVMNLEEE